VLVSAFDFDFEIVEVDFGIGGGGGWCRLNEKTAKEAGGAVGLGLVLHMWEGEREESWGLLTLLHHHRRLTTCARACACASVVRHHPSPC
jgi:hypothetical protein